MRNKILVTTAILLATTASFAADFQSGSISAMQAKQTLEASKLKNTPFNQLFICNNTNLPNQAGTNIGVSFPQASANYTPAPGACAYVESSSTFNTPVAITNPQGGIVYSQNISSGQMWGVTLNMQTNQYVVAQIQ